MINYMNPGGDAAEQVVRLSLEGVEVAARISGNGAKNIAMLLYATLKQEQKTKGKARLTSMLKSGKELKVYTITQKDLAKFSQEAKRYGVLYCVLKDKNNTDLSAPVDIIARAEDASKIQRITERFKLATVNRADVALDIQKEKDKVFPKDKSVKEVLKGGTAAEERGPTANWRNAADEERMDDPERGLPPAYGDIDIEGRSIETEPKKGEPEINPNLAKTGRDHLSAPNSTQTSQSFTQGITDRPIPTTGKPSGEDRVAGRSSARTAQESKLIAQLDWPQSTADRPSVREKLNVYKAEIAGEKADKAKELAREMVSKGIDAAKSVPVPKAPGRER